MIELTEQQRLGLSGATTEVIDPQTKETYILIRKAVYERIRNLLVDDTVYASGDLIDRVMAEDDANDPYLSSYQSMAVEDK